MPLIIKNTLYLFLNMFHKCFVCDSAGSSLEPFQIPPGEGNRRVFHEKITKHAAWSTKKTKQKQNAASSKQPCQYNPMCQSMERWMKGGTNQLFIR